MRIYIVEFPRLSYCEYSLSILYTYNRAYGFPAHMESNEKDSSLAIF